MRKLLGFILAIFICSGAYADGPWDGYSIGGANDIESKENRQDGYGLFWSDLDQKYIYAEGGSGGGGSVYVNTVEVADPDFTDNNDVTFGVAASVITANVLNIDMTSTGVGKIDFDFTGATSLDGEGQLIYNPTKQVLTVRAGTGHTLDVGAEISPLCKNSSGVAIANGDVVYITGTVGATGVYEIAKFIADCSIDGRLALGVATVDIANGGFGQVTRLGEVNDINTTGTPESETWSIGDVIYASATVAGQKTNIEPAAGNCIIVLGEVGRVNAVTGSLQVNMRYYPRPEELSGVNGTALTADGQVMAWSQTNGYYDFDYNLNDYYAMSGTTGQTLYFSGTDVLTASSYVFNTGSKLIVGATAITQDTFEQGMVGQQIFGDVTKAITDSGSGSGGSNANLLDDDCTSFTGWNNIGGTLETYQGDSTFNFNDNVERVLRTVATSANNRVISVPFYGATVGVENGLWYRYDVNTSWGVEIIIDSAGIKASSDGGSSWSLLASYSIPDSTTKQTFTIDIDTIAEDYDIYIDTTKYVTSGSVKRITGLSEDRIIVGSFGSTVNIYTDKIQLGDALESAGYTDLITTSGYTLADYRTDYITATDNTKANLVVEGKFETGDGLYTKGEIKSGGDVDINDGDFTVDTTTGYVGIGTATPSVELEVVGRVIEDGTYGNIHVHTATAAAQSIPTGTTYTKSTGFSDNGLSSNMTADATNDKLTITKAGVYSVYHNSSFSSGTANVIWWGALFLGGVEQNQCHWQRKTSSSGDVGSAGQSCLIDVTSVPADLDLRVRHDNGGSINYTMDYAGITATYEGET
jgi:hypothetical protein